MPRIRVTETVSGKSIELTNRLYTELAKGDESVAALQQPYILEQEIGPKRFLHVVVFWNDWAGVPEEHRGAIIMDAYEKFDRALPERITLALGVTLPEAESLGLLPFQIQPLVRASDNADMAKVRDLMLKHGGYQIGHLVRLRLPTRQLADKTFHVLEEEYPLAHWALAEETAVASGT